MKKLLLILLCVPLIFSCGEAKKKNVTYEDNESEIRGFYKVFDEDGKRRAMNESYFGDDGYMCIWFKDKGSGREIPGVDVCDCKLESVGHYLFNDDGTITITVQGESSLMNIEHTDKGFILTMAGTPFYKEFQKVNGDNITLEEIRR